MRQLLLALSTFICLQSGIAQTTVTVIEPHYLSTPTKIALIGGYNLTTAHIDFGFIETKPASTLYHNGFGLGVQLERQFDGIIYFTPSAMINNRGYGYTTKSNTNVITTDKTSIFYLDLAPALSVKLNFPKWQPDGKIVLMMGLQAGMALSGTEKNKVGTHAQTSKSMHFTISSGYSLIDLGFKWAAAYETKKGFLQLGYQLGFVNIDDDNTEVTKRYIENRQLSLSLGYFIK